MIWLTWRQYRMETMIGLVLLAVIGGILLGTGMEIGASFQSMGVSHCLSPQLNPQSCGPILSAFDARFGSWVGEVQWLNLFPMLIAILLGAPFVHELEQGTYRLAWTQSITRSRWLGTRVSLIAAAGVVAALVFTLLMTWWRGPWDKLHGSIQPNSAFDFEGIAPIAYTLFALALVLALGAVLRRTIPAVGIAAVTFVAVRIGVQTYARPHFVSPSNIASSVEASQRLGGGSELMPIGGPRPTDWVLQGGWVDPQGHSLSDAYVLRVCAPLKTASDKIDAARQFPRCLNAHSFLQLSTFQPANRFWTLQFMEASLFLGLAALLVATVVWWVRFRAA